MRVLLRILPSTVKQMFAKSSTTRSPSKSGVQIDHDLPYNPTPQTLFTRSVLSSTSFSFSEANVRLIVICVSVVACCLFLCICAVFLYRHRRLRSNSSTVTNVEPALHSGIPLLESRTYSTGVKSVMSPISVPHHREANWRPSPASDSFSPLHVEPNVSSTEVRPIAMPMSVPYHREPSWRPSPVSDSFSPTIPLFLAPNNSPIPTGLSAPPPYSDRPRGELHQSESDTSFALPTQTSSRRSAIRSWRESIPPPSHTLSSMRHVTFRSPPDSFATRV